MLAGSDFHHENHQSVSVRIIDASSRQQVREIEGLALVTWMPDNNLLTFRFGAAPEAAIDYVLITHQGKPVREFESGNISPVPGGR